MHVNHKPLEVHAIPGERMCFFVHSEADPRNVYRVDLLALEGRSECHCKWWRTRIWPIIRDGGESTCKHVDAARQFFLRDLLRHMARLESET